MTLTLILQPMCHAVASRQSDLRLAAVFTSVACVAEASPGLQVARTVVIAGRSCGPGARPGYGQDERLGSAALSTHHQDT